MCTTCKTMIPISMCKTFPFPIKATKWTCLPCGLPPPYRDALVHLRRHATTIADTASHFQVERSQLTHLARWHRVLESIPVAPSSHAPPTAPPPPLYTKTHLMHAVAYAAEHKCGCRRAARATEMHFHLPPNSVPHATVHQHMQQPRRRSKPGARLKLSVFEESLVAQQWILQQETHGTFLTKAQAADDMVTQLCRRNRPNPFVDCVNQRPSEGFWRGFLKRHPAVRFKSMRPPSGGN
ncbi:Aste57867_13722 [Aphanomyces stellatus]|uniref:Aste57867_13722 protein n=1 Tax=Aphanomyces stellatus TaxID=120398 RepID=A0A485KYV1_9STRA|nr:hypothetical protein As57867_013672 [Aphanomyces stellatus]VFT90555.1 Aste57867_13722 [Aphanomyces stellatus]